MSRVDILSPHYDDAVLSAWHQIEQPETRVVTVFGGIPQNSKSGLWDRLAGSSRSPEIVRARQQENEAALASTAALAINLSSLDRQYQPLTTRDIESITDEIEDVSEVDTSILAPVGIGTYFRVHPDHVDTRRVGIELMNRGYDVSFYADIPYLLPVRDIKSWPMKLSKKRIEKVLGMPVNVEPYQLTHQEQINKQQALSKFTSQMPMVNKLAFGALKNVDAYKWEVVIRPN